MKYSDLRRSPIILVFCQEMGDHLNMPQQQVKGRMAVKA